jgi:vitamin B12 transporter
MLRSARDLNFWFDECHTILKRIFWHRFLPQAVAPVIIFFGHFTYAVDDPELSTVVVVGTRIPSPESQGERVTTVFREQIERIAAANGVDLLRQVPGLQVDQAGSPGGVSLVYIRGSDPNHVLVLVDGVRVNDPTNSRGGGFDFSSLDPSQIERIDVFRGAASAIYGADAMGGVINIVTRNRAHGRSTGASAGTNGYRSLNARATQLFSEGTRISSSASALEDGLESDGGELKLNQFSIGAGASPSASSHLELSVRYIKRESSAFPDDSGGIELATIRGLEYRDSRATVLGLRGTANTEAWTLVLEGTGFEHRAANDSPGVSPGLRSEFGIPAARSSTLFRRAGVTFSGVRKIKDGTELAIGAEYQEEYGTSDTVYEQFGMLIPVDFALRRKTPSAFSELKWLVSQDFVMRAGVRGDYFESDSQVSPSLSARYSVGRLGGQLTASYSEGFKLPSFFALGLPAPLGGNPELKAEYSDGGSLGYEQFLNGIGDVSLSVFQRRYTDLVTFESNGNQLVNASRVDTEGAEFAIRVTAGDFIHAQVHYTRLTSKVSPSGESLRQRPGKRAGLILDVRPFDKASVAWGLEYADEIFDSSIPTGNVWLHSYLRNDVTFTYAINRQAKLLAAIDNFADRNNRWYIGSPSMGRRGRIGIEVYW